MKYEEESTYYYNYKFNSVIVIESLAAPDKLTGKELFDDIIKPFSWRDGYEPVLKQVRTKQEFLAVMSELASAVSNKNYFPILHLEMHGSKNLDGLITASRELITWNELAQCCRTINIALKNTLNVALATCHGAHFYNGIDPQLPSPFWCVIGPRDEVDEGVLLADFTSFYSSYFNDKDLQKALDALNMSRDQPFYKLLPAEAVFDRIKAHAVEMAQTNDFNTIKMFDALLKQKMPGSTSDERMSIIKDRMNHFASDEQWDRQRKIFLMQ